MKIGSTGRHVSPGEKGIFKNDGQTGWGQHKITLEECELRLEVNEKDMEVMNKDIERLEFELNELKL